MEKSARKELIYYRSDNSLISKLSLLFMIFFGSISFVGSQIISTTHNDPKLLFKPGLTGLPHLKSEHIQKIPEKIFFALFLTYIFPFKPHGSLFTTSFATLLWFLYTLNLYSIKNDRNK